MALLRTLTPRVKSYSIENAKGKPREKTNIKELVEAFNVHLSMSLQTIMLSSCCCCYCRSDPMSVKKTKNCCCNFWQPKT